MENANNMTRLQKLTFSAMVMALYIVVLCLTSSFSFGAYQIRIATSLYALAYLFPFLVVPLGLANLLSNMLFGGFGVADMLGGFLVGVTTAACIVLIRRKNWSRMLIAVPIVLVPGLGVATYLSYILAIPYPLMALNLCVGQLIPSAAGVALVKLLERARRPSAAAGRALCTASVNTSSGSMRWSAGSTSSSACSPPVSCARKAARAMAGAVLRWVGSRMMSAAGSCRTASLTWKRCASLLTTMSCAGSSRAQRASVSASRLLLPNSMNCLGCPERERGQSREPVPPQRMTGKRGAIC